MTEPTADKTLDARGLLCPLPILKAKKALNGLPKGGVLEVLATDPGSVADFEAFCRTTGNTLVEKSADAGDYRFLIRHSG
jgi:tRNA 2-thiouridine synthesizing protein A